jgi:divalent metal cation (Fe/Co/Zn/Cd) transporter
MSEICPDVKPCSIRLRILSVVVSLFLSVVKGGIGILGKSEALVADGLYSFYQSFISARSLISKKDMEPDKDNDRPPLLTNGQVWFVSIVVGLILSLGLFDVLIFSIIKLIKSASGMVVDPSPYAFYVAALSIVANYSFSRYSKCVVKQPVMKNIAELDRSFRLSVIISSIALVGIGLSRWLWLGGDALATIILVGLIIKPVFGLFYFRKGAEAAEKPDSEINPTFSAPLQ